MVSEERERDEWKRKLHLGLSLAFFFLWLPLIAPHLMSGWQPQDVLWRSRGIQAICAAVGGFSAILLLDRYTTRATGRKWQHGAGIFLLLMTPTAVFVPLPPLAGLFALFASSSCVALQMLPAIKALCRETVPLLPLCIGVVAGGALASCGIPLLTWCGRTWPTLYGLPVVTLACLLLTGGEAIARHIEEAPPAKQDAAGALYVIIDRIPKSKSVMFRSVGLLACCAGSLLLTAILYATRAEELSSAPVLQPLFLAVAAGVSMVPKIKGGRKLRAYCATLGLTLGGLMLSAGFFGTFAAYVNLFFLLLGLTNLGLLTAECLRDWIAPINRTCLLGFGVVTFFLFLWLSADPGQLQWMGEGLSGGVSGGGAFAVTAALFAITPLTLAGRRGIAARGTGTRGEMLWEGSAKASRREAAAAEGAVATAGGAGAGAEEREGDEAEAETRAGARAETETEAGNAYRFRSGLEDHLTATEKKVYRLILMGYSNQQMADELFVSINTIKFHIKNILPKAGVSKKSHLMGQLGQRAREGADDASGAATDAAIDAADEG